MRLGREAPGIGRVGREVDAAAQLGAMPGIPRPLEPQRIGIRAWR